MRIRNLIKNIKKNKEDLNSVVGSVCITVAILTEQSEEAAFREFCKLKKELHNKQFTMRKIFKRAFTDMVTDEQYKANIPFAVLLTDERGIFSPRVTMVVEGHALPLRKDGLEVGIIASFNNENNTHISAEPLFDSLDDFENEEAA